MKNQKQEITVVEYKCPYCGEVHYVVAYCFNCGENTEVGEIKKLTVEELKELMQKEHVEFIGPSHAYAHLTDEKEAASPVIESDSLTSLSANEVDELLGGDSGLTTL